MRYFVVDCHPHIYAEDRKKYPPVKDFVDHVEPATTQDLRRRMETNGVDRAVFIQTGTFYQFDNRYVMDSCVEHADWATGVLLLDPDNENDLVVLERAVECGARGLRGQPDKDGKINSAAVFRLWSKAHSLGMVVNCHVGNDHPIEEVEDICARLPNLPIVLDHCLYLSAVSTTAETLANLKRLSKLPNVHAKLTTLSAKYSAEPWPHADLHGPYKSVISYFGAERCVRCVLTNTIC